MPVSPQMIDIFSRIHPLTEEFIHDLSMELEVIQIPKKTKWVSYGEICRYALFLEEGLLYSSYEETKYTVTSWFMKENEFVISVESFLRQKPSKETITAIEDCVAVGLKYENMKRLIQDHPCFHIVYTNLIEHYYILSEERTFNLRKREATDRYRFLLEYHGEIVQRVPLHLIASYLCINMETLSRIRRKI